MAGFGLSVDVPDGWDAHIYRRPEGDPTLHTANLPLAPDDGDFGAGTLESMTRGGIFLVVTEYDAALAGRGLFEPGGVPGPFRPLHFSPAALQRPRRGLLGLQRFFTAAGRAFCLYAVLGARSRLDARPLVAEANRTIRSIRIEPAG